MKPTRQGSCRSCGAPIVWMRTEQGQMMPVDADSVDEAELEYDDDGTPRFQYGTHASHFASCDQADRWRKPRRTRP